MQRASGMGIPSDTHVAMEKHHNAKRDPNAGARGGFVGRGGGDVVSVTQPPYIACNLSLRNCTQPAFRGKILSGNTRPERGRKKVGERKEADSELRTEREKGGGCVCSLAPYLPKGHNTFNNKSLELLRGRPVSGICSARVPGACRGRVPRGPPRSARAPPR